MKKLYYILTFLIVFLNFLSADDIKFNIISTADIHGNLYSSQSGVVALNNIIEKIRKSNPNNTFVLDSGDLIQGNPINKLEKGRLMIEAMNLIKFDFMTIGNHELDFGVDNLIKVYSKSNATLLATNLKCKGLNILPYKIVERQGVKLGFVGLSERNLRNRLYNKDKRLEFYNNDLSLRKAISHLMAEKVDIIILLSHDGLYFRGGTIYKFTRKFPMIDIIIGGHTHTLAEGQNINNSFYIQSEAYAKSLIDVEINFDTKLRKITRIGAKKIATTAYDTKSSYNKFANIINEWYRLVKIANKPIYFDASKFQNSLDFQENILLAKMQKSLPKADVYINFLQKYDTNKKYHLKNINLFLYHKLFPYEEEFIQHEISCSEYKIIIKELRKISQKFDNKLFIYSKKDLSKLDKISIVTSNYISTGCANPQNPIKNILK